MNRFALLPLLLIAGCAVPLSADLSLTVFNRTPSSVNVGTDAQTVTCQMTITAGGGRSVQYAACKFVSPQGRAASCLATNPVGDLWSCDFEIPKDSENATWTIDYIFAEDDLGAKLFATNAELVADFENVLEGDATRVDLTVTSPSADTTPPVIDSFSILPTTVDPGETVTCTIGATDDSPIKDSGCTFLPDDSSPSISCSTRGAVFCSIAIPGDATAGVTYTEVNHFARDTALNVTVANSSSSFEIATPPSGWTPVDSSEWPGPMLGTACSAGAITADCICDGGEYDSGYCVSTPETVYLPFSAVPSSVTYVVPGGTGAATGADWANAADVSVLDNPTRGMYWIASGTYQTAQLFWTAAGGSTSNGLMVRKATEAEHGTATGWDAAYGQGQAVFGALNIQAEYVVIDGGENRGIKFFAYALYGAGEPYSTVDMSDVAVDHVVLRRIEIDGNFSHNGTAQLTGSCQTLAAFGGSRHVIDRVDMHTVADDGVEWPTMDNSRIFRSKIHGLHGAGTTGDIPGPCVNGHSDGIELALNSDDNLIAHTLVYDIKGGNGALITGNYQQGGSNSERNRFVNNLFFSQSTYSPVELFDLDDSEFIGNIILGTYQQGSTALGGLTIHQTATNLSWVNNYITTVNTSVGNGDVPDSAHWTTAAQTAINNNVYGNLFGTEATAQTNDVDLDSSTVPQFVGLPFSTSFTEMELVAVGLTLSDLEPATGGSVLGAGTTRSNEAYSIDGASRPLGTWDVGAFESLAGGTATGGAGGAGGAGGVGGAPPTCTADPQPTYSPQGTGWIASPVQETAADATLTWEVYARTAELNTDAGFAVYESAPIDYSDASLLVRFSNTNNIEVGVTGSDYECDTNSDGTPDTCPTYAANTWYRFVITANLTTDTYTVQYEQCDSGPLSMVHGTAPFRTAATSLEYHRGWSWAATLDVASTDWNAGTCTPLTCSSFGADTCNVPPDEPADGCGSVLDCDTAAGGDCETRSGGAAGDVCNTADLQCCTPSGTWCNDNSKDCGLNLNNCTVEINCGTCTGGEQCILGECCDVATWCSGQGYECGNWDATPTCAGTVDCGTCGTGASCNTGTGQCESGGDWWETTLQPTAANTGPNCTGRAGCPSATLTSCSFGQAPCPPQTISSSGTWSNFDLTSDDVLLINSDNVTLTNFKIQTSGSFALGDNGDFDNVRVEYGEIVCTAVDCAVGVNAEGWDIQYIYVHGFDDAVRIVPFNDAPVISNTSYLRDSLLFEPTGGHGDAIQYFPFPVGPNHVFERNVLWGGGTGAVSGVHHTVPVLFKNNWFYPNGLNVCGQECVGGYGIYCEPTFTVTANLFQREGWICGVYPDGCDTIPTRGAWDEGSCIVSENRFTDDLSLIPGQ